MDNKKTILVTGGAGYIGSFTVNELLLNGYNVVIYDNLENGHRESINPGAKLEIGDIGDSKRLDEVLKKYQIDAVIDFAAYLAVGESMQNPVKYLENNVYNFITVLDALKRNGVDYIIKSSTASVYGNPLNDEDYPLKENYLESYKPKESELLPGKWDDAPIAGEDFFQKIISHYQERMADRTDLQLNLEEITKLRIPTSVYGLTKLLDEMILKKYNINSGIKYTALRYFNVCGASIDGEFGDDKPNPTNLMTMVIFSALEKIPAISIFGNDYPTKDGTGLRDYIHPLDLAAGHVAALQYMLENNQSGTYNLGTGNGFSVLDVIGAVEKAAGKKVKYEIAPRRPGDVVISLANPTQAYEKFGWKAQYSLDQMAETAWQWHNKYPNGYMDK